MVEEKEKSKKEKPRFELIEVPTEMGLAYKDNSTDENLSQAELLIRMANDVFEIKRGIVGGK